jgi:hypothetical protein
MKTGQARISQQSIDNLLDASPGGQSTVVTVYQSFQSFERLTEAILRETEREGGSEREKAKASNSRRRDGKTST